MSKCDGCPVKLGLCVGERASHAFACKMAERGTESELRWIGDESLGRPPEPPARLVVEKAAVSHTEFRNATKLGSKNCWFAERDAGCGCNGLQCHLLGRRINIHDCVECLRRW